jgi:hypothetical protein
MLHCTTAMIETRERDGQSFFRMPAIGGADDAGDGYLIASAVASWP